MLIEKPQFHARAQDTIAKLRSDGIECTPAEIVWLNHAAGKCIHPAACDELLFLDPPYPCGNTLLWPLSIGARIWLDQCGRPWFKGAGDLEQLVFTYAMAHSRTPAILRALATQTQARFAVAKWAAGLSATLAELQYAASHAMSPDDVDLVNIEFQGERKKIASDYGDVVALLCQFVKDDPHYWLWSVSEDLSAALLKKISSQLPGDRQISSDHAKFIAVSQYNLIVTQIRKAHAPSVPNVGRVTSPGAPAAPTVGPVPSPGAPSAPQSAIRNRKS